MEQTKTNLYTIKKGFAANEGLPIIFIAKELTRTQRAVYLFGHGTTQSTKKGCCMICGRELTHPVSVELGIGPECGKHYWDWDSVGGYTKENIKRLAQKIQTDIKIDDWFPQSVIIEKEDSEEIVTVPHTHPILKPKEQPVKSAELVQFLKTKKQTIQITFPFNLDDLKTVKSLMGRKYNPDGKYWTCPVIAENIKELAKHGFELDNSLKSYIKQEEEKEIRVNQLDSIKVPGIPLYPFQEKGVAFIEANKGRALIGDEMGLGKTVQALAYLQLHSNLRPAVIIVPASLKLNWEREINRWLTDNQKTEIISGKEIHTLNKDTDIFIINYDILPEWQSTLSKLQPKILITDECHYYKNNKALRTKAVMKLGKSCNHIIALSGTPIVNRPIEILNAVSLIDPQLFPNRWHFLMRYCGAKNNGYGWDFTGSSNTKELHEKLTKSIMIRRLKKDVLQDLPEKTKSFVPIKLNNKKEYQAAESNFIRYIKNNIETDFKQQLVGFMEKYNIESIDFGSYELEKIKAEKASKINILTEIEGLKQLAVEGKIKGVIDWIKDFLESGKKLVVFTTHKFTIDKLYNEFKNMSVKVDGSVIGTKRQKAVDYFQNDSSIRLFFGNIKAAGVGITLTAASSVAIVEYPWTPGELEQAIDRVHRIGQKYPVNAYLLMALNTIEERIAHLLDKKQVVLNAVLDGQDTQEETLLTELINQYKI